MDTTAKEMGGVSLGRPLSTMKEAGYGVSREICEYHSKGEEYMCYFRETCGYHSRLEGYGVCPGEACFCQLLTDNLLRVTIYNFVQNCGVLARNNELQNTPARVHVPQPRTRKAFLLAFLMPTGV